MNKFKFNSLFGFLGVALLAISLPLTIYMIKTNNLDFRLFAFESEEPQKVTITDISANSFKISWITQKPVFGSVKLSANLQTVVDTAQTSYHNLVVKNLNPGTDYNFQVLSGSTVYPTSYTAHTTNNVLVNANHWLIGQVFDKDGTKTQKGGVLTLQLKSNDTQSQLLSTAINETGGYQINLGPVLTNDLQRAFTWEQKNDLVINVYTEYNKDPVTKTFTMDLMHESQVPNIYLGDININIIPGVQGN